MRKLDHREKYRMDGYLVIYSILYTYLKEKNSKMTNRTYHLLYTFLF